MTLQEELQLSYYKQISILNASHNVFLVQHVETGKLYVKKILSVYDKAVYDQLCKYPLENTPRIYAVVEDDSRLIIIEEYINGETLEEIVQRDGPLSESYAVQILMQLCVIVNGLHSYFPPIIHRDLKPSNVIVSNDGIVKLLDMNAAKHYKGSSGEGDIPKRSLATGQIGHIVEKCTAIDPNDRYQNAAELFSALEKYRPFDKTKAALFIKWLPPGFRTLNPVKMLLSGFLYVIFFMAAMQLDVKNDPLGKEWIDKVFFRVFFLVAVAFIGNYMDIWHVFRADRIKQPILRIVWICFIAFIALLLTLAVMMIVEDAAGYASMKR